VETVHRVLEVLRPHWNTLALLLTWVGIGFVYLRRRKQWHRKAFLAQVNFSLNYVAGSTLAMRTLVEKPANQVWLNEYGVRMVLAAAHKTTVGHPFIILKHPKDRDFANRAVLNVLSERFAEGFVAAALGLPVKTAPFCFAITCEKYEEIRTLKLRVLIVAEQTLIDLFGPDDGAAKLEVTSVIYQARLKTLRAMYELYAKDRQSEQPVLGQVELGVAIPQAVADGGPPQDCVLPGGPLR
jgi:hypothetical protein